uniref:Uncharacterized protein n=1 Tax=Lactuca sativa TaxID=4236 RepID=A0A9R1XJT8_LACSA|nr:hypothetical protein LSAT_V11C300141940 [Lactuca sativa]
MLHYFNVRHAHTPHVIVKQVALMAKASAHSLRSFNREKVHVPNSLWIVDNMLINVTRLNTIVLLGHLSSPHFLMKRIGHNHHLMNYFQI